MSVLRETVQEPLRKPGTTAAEATWQRESSHSATVRSCLARGNWQQGSRNAAFTKFLWVSFTHPRPGWCGVFAYYYMWAYTHPWAWGTDSNSMFNAGLFSRLTNNKFVNIKSLKQSNIIISNGKESISYCIYCGFNLQSDYLRCLHRTWHISCNRSIACRPGVISKLLPPFYCKACHTTQFEEVTPLSISTHCRSNKSDCERKQNSTRGVQLAAEKVWILLAVRLVGGDYHSYSGSGCFFPSPLLLRCD